MSSQHRAIQCTKLDGPLALQITNVPTPQPDDNEVLIAVKAVGVAFPDVLITQGKYQFKPSLPFSPGGK
jgi:NADPH2:quinone reductase